MSYQTALEIAGATIHEFKEFGSYQGDWWAKVTYKGQDGWVRGSYGSCSGCDSFQGEFDNGYHEHTDDKYFDTTYNGKFLNECSTCNSINEKMILFGESYLDGIMSQEEAEKYASKHLEWDMEAQEMLEWIKEKKI